MLENILILFVGLCIITVGMVIALRHILNKKRIELVGWTIFFCVSLYGIGFPFVFLSTHFGKNVLTKTNYIMDYNFISIIYYGALVCAMISAIYIGWLLVNNRNLIVFSNGGKNYKIDDDFKGNIIVSKLIKFSWFLFILSFVTYYIYSMAYGGFLGLLSYTKSIRAGVSELPNQFSFFKQFGQFSIISAYIFYGLVIDKRVGKKFKKTCYIGSVISGLFSLYVLYSWGGRSSIVLFVLVYVLGSIYNKSDMFINVIRKNIKYIPLFPLIFVIIDKLWKSSGNLDFLTLAVSSISYPFIAFIVNFQTGMYRWFQDLFYMPFYFLPSSIWQSVLNIDTANSYTTFLVSGARKGEVFGGRVITGTTPNDFLTFSYMQADIIGVIVLSLFLGAFLRIVHNKIMLIKINGLKWILYSFCIVHLAIKTIAGGDVSQIVISNWAFFVSILLFYVYTKVKFKV